MPGVAKDEIDPADVIEACHALGFALAGVAPAEPTRWRQQYLDWLAAGKHGEMAYLTEHLNERLDVRVLLPGARSVIVVADQYPRACDDDARSVDLAGSGVVGAGDVARYARGRDYHAVIRRRIWALVDQLRPRHPGAVFRPFVDTGPALEREHAVRAGLTPRGDGSLAGPRGFIGKHTLYIHPSVGSCLLLGGIATTVAFRVPTPMIDDADRCGTCTKCIDACPTAAITPYSVDATRCVSYLTLEHRGPIDPALHEGMGNRLLGCDVCQDVCPYNAPHDSPAAVASRVNPGYLDPHGLRGSLPLMQVLRTDQAESARGQMLSGSAAKRASLAMLRRNAVIAAGNAIRNDARATSELRREIERIAGDATEDTLVRETAEQVLRGLARES